MKTLTTAIIAAVFITLFSSSHSFGAIASSEKTLNQKLKM